MQQMPANTNGRVNILHDAQRSHVISSTLPSHRIGTLGKDRLALSFCVMETSNSSCEVGPRPYGEYISSDRQTGLERGGGVEYMHLLLSSSEQVRMSYIIRGMGIWNAPDAALIYATDGAAP